MISDGTIALIKERTDIVALVSESVPTLKRRGRSFVGNCPFHNEKTPSFHVNPERGFYHCFGCNESGTALDFVMKQDGLTFPEAVHELAARCGVGVEETAAKRQSDPEKELREALYNVNAVAAVFYEQQLRRHPGRGAALVELGARGLHPDWSATGSVPKGQPAGREVAEVLQEFRVGYAPAAWDALASHLREQGISPVIGEQAGLIVSRTKSQGYYDRFRNRLMFAIVDLHGRVLGFSGRALKGEGDEGGEPQAKYINSPETLIYKKGKALFGIYQARHAIRRKGSAVVVEGNFDVVSLHARGVANVVAPLGSAFTGDQGRLLKRLTENVTLMFDNDEGGRKALFGARKACKEASLTTKVAVVPSGKDPDEFVREHGEGALIAAVDSSRGLIEHLIEVTLDESFNAADAVGKANRISLVARLLAEEEDPLVRGMAKTYADRLAGRLDIAGADGGFAALEAALRSALSQKASGPKPSSSLTPKRGVYAASSRRQPTSAERAEIVGALVEFPGLLQEQSVQSELVLLSGPAARCVAALAASIKTTATGENVLDSSAFLAQIPPAIQAFVSGRLAAPRNESLDQAREQLLENARKLRKKMLSRETRELARETSKAAGDWEAEVELAGEAQARARMKMALGSYGSSPVRDGNFQENAQEKS